MSPEVLRANDLKRGGSIHDIPLGAVSIEHIVTKGAAIVTESNKVTSYPKSDDFLESLNPRVVHFVSCNQA